MAFTGFYDVGTVSVTAGSANVTGSGTLWTGLVVPGDVLEVAGLMARVLDVPSDTEITLVKPWAGATAAGTDYSVTYASPSRAEGTYVAERVRELITRQTILDRGTAIFAVAGVGTNAPPGAPVEGDTHVIGAAPTGAWVGYVGYLATWSGTAWIYTAPEVGMQVQDLSVDPPVAYVRGASAWLLKSEASVLGDIQDVDTSGAATGDALTHDGADWVPIAQRGANLLFNPCGLINQRGATSQADDTYGFDRWYVLTQTGAVGLSTVSLPADGVPAMMRLTQSQVTAQRMGQAQILEAADSQWMRGRPVTLSGWAKCSTSATLRYAIIAWTGTADAVTSDVINDWTSGSYTAGGFFLGAGLAVVAVGSVALSAGVQTAIPALTASMPSGLNNAIVLYWSEGALAQGGTLDAALQLEEGAMAHRFSIRSYGLELKNCQRYYERLTASAPYTPFGTAGAVGGVAWRGILLWQEKRSSPTVTFSDPSHFAIESISVAISTIGSGNNFTKAGLLGGDLASTSAAGLCGILRAANTTSATISINAEL